MAGALLGAIAGAGLGYFGGRQRQKREQQQNLGELLLKQGLADPNAMDAILADPHAQKIIEPILGKDGAEFLGHVSAAQKASMAEFSAVANGTPTPSAGGQLIGATGPQGAGVIGSAVSPAQGPSQSQPMQPQPSQAQDPNSPEAIDDHIAKIQTFADAHPTYATQAKEHIEELKNKRDFLQKQQDYAETRADRQQAHADTEADRAATRQMQEQAHADALAMRSEALAQSAEMHKFMMGMAQEKATDAKQAHFQSATQNLATRTINIGKMLSAATPSDPATVKALLDARNADAKMLKAEAEKAGIDVDEEQFKPLTVKSVPGYLAKLTGGAIGGSTPTLSEDTAAPAASDGPIATNPKTGDKVRWDGKAWTPVK